VATEIKVPDIGDFKDIPIIEVLVKEGDAVNADDPIISLNMFMADPKSIRYDERVKAGKATINGVSIADKAKNIELGKKIVEMRATNTVAAIRKAIANKGKATTQQ